MQIVRAALEDGWRALDEAVANIRGRAEDDVQVQLFDLAVSFAELSAADVLIQHASSSDAASDPLVEQITKSFLGLALANLDQTVRFVSNCDALNSDSVELIRSGRSEESVNSLGDALRKRDGLLAADGLSEDKRVIRNSIRQFTEEKVLPFAESIHREDLTIPDELIDGVRELGCFGLSVPSEFGGLKPGDAEDSIGMVVVTEELSRGSLGAAGSLITRPEIMVRALLEGGSEEQKARWLPKLASGESLCAISVTEPGTGSDVASVALRAKKTEGGWLLNGAKTWCTFAGKASLILVLARTDIEAKPPHRGLSMFVIDKPSTDAHEFVVNSPRGGHLSGKAISTLGYRGMHSYEMFYDEFFVPDSNLVGETEGEGRGFYYTMRGFSGGRLQTAARASGVMQAAYEAALRFAEQRKVFDRAIAEYSLTKLKLVKMASYITAVRQYSYAVARMMDRGEGQLEASLVKLIACRYAEWVTREALQIHGGMGYAEETPVSRYFVDARVLSIFEGAEETLALRVVGRTLLSESKNSLRNR